MTAEPIATTGVIDLGPLFAPRSVAVVGASARGGIAQTVRDNLRVTGSSTRCHFVNPRHDELLGQPCYPSIAALPERPDLVMVALHPLRATAVTREAAAAGVPAVIIPSGGVVEGGPAAATMQAEVAAIAREHGMALVGPNCMGVWDLTSNSSAYIGDVNPWLPRGGIAGIAQSGSVTDAFIHSGARIGFSRIVGCGVEAVLDVCDYLAWSLDDTETHGVILFVEGFKRPERFLALADHALEIGKPVAVLKVGRSEQAQAAAIAHTGSLAGEARVTDAALDAAGVIRCRDLDELLETAELIDGTRRTRRGVGRGRTGVVTVSTGEASLIADLVPHTGIDLPPIPPAAREAIAAALPTMGFVANPLDPWGADDPATAYDAAFEALAASGAYDVLVLVHDFPYRSLPSEVETASIVTRSLIRATSRRPRVLPVFVSLTSGDPTPEIARLLDEAAGGAPMLRGAVEAFAAIARLAGWEERRVGRLQRGPRRAGWPALAADRRSHGFDLTVGVPARVAVAGLPEQESLAIVARAGVPVVEHEPAASVEAAIAAAGRVGYPVVVKVDAVGLAHKSEIGAVRVGLADEPTLRAAADDLLRLSLPPGAERRGLLVAAMAEPGIEMIVGARRDPLFGPVVIVGLGGVLAEVLDDVALALAPLTIDDARELVQRLRGAAVLRGVRGASPVAVDAVGAVLVALADLLMADAGIVDVEINPLIATVSKAVAVDALVVRD